MSYYNWFPPISLGSEAVDAFCFFESNLCTTLMSDLINPEVDNIERF